jgi:hypothetical protein
MLLIVLSLLFCTCNLLPCPARMCLMMAATWTLKALGMETRLGGGTLQRWITTLNLMLRNSEGNLKLCWVQLMEAAASSAWHASAKQTCMSLVLSNPDGQL